MKKLLPILLLAASSTLACGPYFPPSYISDLDDSYFVENINIPMELMLLAREYELIDKTVFPTNNLSSLETDLTGFTQCAKALGMDVHIPAYTAYAKAVRSNPPEDIDAPELPAELREFTLYLKGMKEMKANPNLLVPPSWTALLELPAVHRGYRTSWVRYMLGNLAASHGYPAVASEHYAACRQTVRDGMADSLGLAGASYKREFLAQTNTAARIRCGVQAIGYYQQSGESDKMTHCLEHFGSDFSKTTILTKAHLETPLGLEVSALYYSGSHEPRSVTVNEQLEKTPPLKITPRLAWFLYRRGETERATAYLANCPEGDPLANWLRFRIAQRNGDTDAAIGHLRLWFEQLQNNDRIVFGFKYYGSHTPQADIHGILGNLLVTQGQMQDALVAFVAAGSYSDAALIAERYLETDTLKSYVDTFTTRPAESHKQQSYYKTVETPEYIERRLSYLLARRLFREDRIDEALAYYPQNIADLVLTYQTALTQADDRRLSRNERSAHLFHAARIMRWNGMEIRGTEFGPDYTLIGGDFGYAGINEEITNPTNLPALYRDSAPEPDVRFHYRYLAAELAGQAAELARNRHQRATILWCAGEWIQMRDPKAADVHYKKLARIRFQPLAKVADKTRWFPRPTDTLDKVFRSKVYIKPAALAKAAADYQTPPPK